MARSRTDVVPLPEEELLSAALAYEGAVPWFADWSRLGGYLTAELAGESVSRGPSGRRSRRPEVDVLSPSVPQELELLAVGSQKADVLPNREA
jgi:hypothetical protein